MNWPSPPMIRQQVTSQNPTAVFPHRLWPIAARGSRAYFPFAPLALERMCRCPQVLGLTQFKTTTCFESKTLNKSSHAVVQNIEIPVSFK